MSFSYQFRAAATDGKVGIHSFCNGGLLFGIVQCIADKWLYGYTVTLGWKQWEEVKISVCYDYIGRIMNNLLSNLLKYADKTKEILLDMGICQDEFFFSIMNAAANKEQDHRGTGIGVHNIEIMMEQMQGRCEEECGEESYRICLYFPLEKSENS